jgi:hypothetical protein
MHENDPFQDSTNEFTLYLIYQSLIGSDSAWRRSNWLHPNLRKYQVWPRLILQACLSHHCLIFERAGVEETKSAGVTVEVSEQESEDQEPDTIPANATDQDVPHVPGETELAREDAVKSDTVGDAFLERVEKLASDTLALQAQQAPTLKSGQVCCVGAPPEHKR